MSDDLVARLRNCDNNFYAESSLWFDDKLANAVDEAADEIERLQSQVHEGDEVQRRSMMLLVERAERAEAERDALRALLAEAREWLGDNDHEESLIRRIDAALREGK